MLFKKTEIPGGRIIELDKKIDGRGFFARGWCSREFRDEGLPGRAVQMNISFNNYKHTLRGFHYQVPPYEEDKLIRCVRGGIFDVLIDLRSESPAFMQHIAIELNAANHRTLLIPKGCANAFLTLEDETEVIYLVSQFYTPTAERGLRWNDPALGINWPAEPAVISEKDRSWPDCSPGVPAFEFRA